MGKLNISNRQLFLLVSLEETIYSTSQELADMLNVSVRTVKNEISSLRKILDINKIEIISKPGYGYSIKIYNHNYFDDVTNTVQEKNIKKIQDFSKDSFNRITYIIRELLTAEKYIKIDQLAEELFVSRSTLENDLNEVRIQLRKYNIKVLSKPNYGLKLSCSEFDLRRCISEYFYNQPVTAPSLSNNGDEKNEILQIESILIDKSNKNHLMLSEFSIKNIAIHIYISIFRFNNGFEYNEIENKEINDISTNAILTAREVYQELGTNIRYSKEEIDYLALHLDSKQIIEDPAEHEFDDKEVIEEIIREIKRNFNLDFSNDVLLTKFLMQHVPQMIKRIRRGLVIRNPLLQDNMRKYLFALKITESAVYILENNYDVTIPLDEFGYLMLYFQNALNRIKENRKIVIGFIMGRGRSDTIVYQQEIREKLPHEEFEIVSFQNWREINTFDNNIDILVSIYPISDADLKYKVNIEDGNYIEAINNYAYKIKVDEIKIEKYFKPEYFVANLKGHTKKEIYENIIDFFREEKIIVDDIEQTEPFVAQEIGNEMLHLQDLYKICRRPVGFIGILDEPMIWNKSIVKVFFLIKTKRDGDKDLPIICQLFSDFISDPIKVASLKEKKDFENFKNNLIRL